MELLFDIMVKRIHTAARAGDGWTIPMQICGSSVLQQRPRCMGTCSRELSLASLHDSGTKVGVTGCDWKTFWYGRVLIDSGMDDLGCGMMIW